MIPSLRQDEKRKSFGTPTKEGESSLDLVWSKTVWRNTSDWSFPSLSAHSWDQYLGVRGSYCYFLPEITMVVIGLIGDAWKRGAYNWSGVGRMRWTVSNSYKREMSNVFLRTNSLFLRESVKIDKLLSDGVMDSGLRGDELSLWCGLCYQSHNFQGPCLGHRGPSLLGLDNLISGAWWSSWVLWALTTIRLIHSMYVSRWSLHKANSWDPVQSVASDPSPNLVIHPQSSLSITPPTMCARTIFS